MCVCVLLLIILIELEIGVFLSFESKKNISTFRDAYRQKIQVVEKKVVISGEKKRSQILF